MHTIRLRLIDKAQTEELNRIAHSAQRLSRSRGGLGAVGQRRSQKRTGGRSTEMVAEIARHVCLLPSVLLPPLERNEKLLLWVIFDDQVSLTAKVGL